MYDRKFNALSFFQPIVKLAENAAEVLKTIDIGASSGTHGSLLCMKACSVRQLAFTLTEELAGGTSVAPRVVFKKQPTPLSASGESTIGTVIVPDATAVGKVVYKDVTPVAFVPGDCIEISWVIGTGTPTGQGVWSITVDDGAETPANNSDMIASA